MLIRNVLHGTTLIAFAFRAPVFERRIRTPCHRATGAFH